MSCCNGLLGRIRPPRGIVVVVVVVVAAATAIVAVACLANAVSAGKQPLQSELSTRAPTRIKDAKLVTGWMLNRAPMAGCAPRMIISIGSSSGGLSRTCKARARQRSMYSPNGFCGFCRVETRSSRLGIRSKLKEYCSRNTSERLFQVLIAAK